jgi:hypothetical protein
MQPAQKVTPELAQKLAHAHALGVSFRALARLYGITPSLAHRRVTRTNRRSATQPERPRTEHETFGHAEPGSQTDADPEWLAQFRAGERWLHCPREDWVAFMLEESERPGNPVYRAAHA